jgi:hypothetical protein
LTVAHYADYDACLAFARTYSTNARVLDRYCDPEDDGARAAATVAELTLDLWCDLLNHHLALLNPGAVLRAVDAVLLRETVDRWTSSEPLTTPALARALFSALYAPDEPPALVYAPPRPRAARKPL